MNLREKVENQIADHKKQIESLESVKELIEKYPELRVGKDRWNNEYYTCSEINHLADCVFFKHSCGCCADAPVLAYFYKEINGIKVFAYPYSIGIGESNPRGIGDYPYQHWRESLAKHHIPLSMQEKVEAYFKDHLPEYFDDNEEEEN